MPLAVPLLNSQIEAASRFWSEGWESKELVQLKQVFPKPLEAIKLKAVVLNVLYGTYIMAILRVGQCLEEKLKATNTTGPDLVEELVAEIAAGDQQETLQFCRQVCALLHRSRSAHPRPVCGIHGSKDTWVRDSLKPEEVSQVR